jgi:hypothetical protein
MAVSPVADFSVASVRVHILRLPLQDRPGIVSLAVSRETRSGRGGDIGNKKTAVGALGGAQASRHKPRTAFESCELIASTVGAWRTALETVLSALLN